MIKPFLTVLILSCLLLSCNRKNKPTSSPSQKLENIDKEEILPKAEFPAVDIQPALEEIPLFIMAEFTKSDCYGGCPAYAAKIYSDGKVEYEGFNQVSRIGKYKASLTGEQIQQIYIAVEKANYFVLKNQYPNDGRFIQDFPTTMTYVKRGGLEKRIQNNFDAPLPLRNFEDWFERFLFSLNWTK